MLRIDPDEIRASMEVVSDDDAYSLFETMTLIERVETSLLDLFSQGLLRGTVHTCLGQEGIAAGIVGALDEAKDIICSNHRGHGHYIAYSRDVRGLIAEIMGRADGVCSGIGGSQHLHLRNFYSNGILGGMVPVATGMAFAEKTAETGAIVTVFFGDGALGEGAIYEAFNIASLWKLPILFVVEDNGYAQSTPKRLEHSGHLDERASPFGIKIYKLDGNDALAVRQVAGLAISEIRRNLGPRLIHCTTYRLAPHSKGDDFRDPDEILGARAKAPIPRLRARLDAVRCDAIERKIDDEVRTIIDVLKGP